MDKTTSKTIFLAIAFFSGLVMSLSLMGIFDVQKAFSVEQKYVDLMDNYVDYVTEQIMNNQTSTNATESSPEPEPEQEPTTDRMTFSDLKQYGLDTSNAYRDENGRVQGWTMDFSDAKAVPEPEAAGIIILK